MKRNFIVIINPISGTGNKSVIRDVIQQEMHRAGFTYTIIPSVASGDYTFLEHDVIEKNITDVIISGGDGTINSVVRHLKKFPVRFGIIPSGSGNGLAFSAGIPKDVKKALAIIFAGKSRWTDAFLINDQYACMLCGLGFDAQVAHDFADSPRRGLITYIRKTIANFITAPVYRFQLHLHEKEFSTDAFFISVANSNQFGNHFTIAPKASLTDGLLDVVIMTRQNKLTVLFNTLKQISGYNPIRSVEMINEHSSLIYFQTEKIGITNTGMAPMHIDGDPVPPAAEVNIMVLKHSFQLMYP